MKFGIRTIAVATAISAVCCAGYLSFSKSVNRQRQAAKAIVELGGEIFYDHEIEERDATPPKWLIDRLGLDVFERLARIDFSRSEIDDIEFLSDLSGVRILTLEQTDVCDLSPIASMKSLRILLLDRTLVNDLAAIQNLTNLHSLYIDDTKINSLRPLHNLKNLTYLNAFRIPAPQSEFTALMRALPNLTINR